MFIIGTRVVRILPIFLLLFVFDLVLGQVDQRVPLHLTDIHKLERLIIKEEFTKAQDLMQTFMDSSPSRYQKILLDIANLREVSYEGFYRFLVNTAEMPDASHQQFSDFIDKNISTPTDFNVLDYGYVKIKWLQMMVLADEAETLTAAQKIETDLLDYINKCKGESVDIKKAKALTESLQIIMYLIQGEIEKGTELCLKTAKLGDDLEDSLLKMTGLYHLADFLVFEGKLEEFIEKSEEVYCIDLDSPYPSPYKTKNMVHLIDAYIFKGGYEDRVTELLEQLYQDTKTRPHSFSLYAQFLTRLPEGSNVQKEILNKFEVDSYVDFSHAIDSMAQATLVPNEYFYVLEFTANMLLKKKEYEAAFLFKDRALELNKKTYSEDLSKSLADFQTEKAVQENEQELQLTKQKSKYYSIIVVLVAALLLISLGVLVNNTKKNKSLRQKNEIIKSSLEEKEKLLVEKQLLFKEMHHRVKNNFQLLSSLLELQNNGIKDENALKMAEEGQNRIKSMALIHQRLYEDDSLTISIKEFVQKLTDEISSLSVKKSKCHIDIQDYKFDVDTAIPLGLILNELLTNIFKYGLSVENPEMKITLVQNQVNDNFELKVWDNGAGLCDNKFFENSTSMGLWLVKRLSRQLGGSARYAYDEGSLFTINFKDTQSRLKIA